MEKKLFPIKTQTACRLKWAWSTLFLNSGQTSSCHRASHSAINKDNFNSFHNTENKIAARQTMLASQWPSGGCEYCKEIEDSGGVSDRVFQNQIHNIYPQELDNDPTLTSVNPVVLEVFFSNTCNLKCIYCEGSLSSAIQAEDEKFGGNILDGTRFARDNHYKDLVPEFWKWFEKNYLSLRRLQILGGEPLLQKDFFQLLDFFDKNPHPDLEFNIVTNLSIPLSILDKAARAMQSLLENKKLKRVDIQASIDCWNHGQTYVRSGIDLDLFQTNLKFLISMRSFRIGLLSTICSLTIPGLDNLVEKYKEWSQPQEIFWYMHLVLPNDSILNPAIFGSDFLIGKLIEIHNSLPDQTWDQQQTQQVLQGIIKKIRSTKKIDFYKQQSLVKYLDKIDTRRNTNWKKTFPWLEKELANVV